MDHVTRALADGMTTNAKSRWGAILASYPEEKRRWDRTFPWIAYVLRPTSFLVTWLLPSWVTANQVTLFSYLVALGSLGFLAAGSSAGFLVGSVLLVLFNLIDCVDGNLARLRGTSDPFGRFLDALAFPAFILPYFALGIGLARAAGPGTGEVVLGLGAGTTILKLLIPQIRETFHLCLGEAWEDRKQGQRAVGHVGRWYYRLYYNLTDLQAHDVVLVLAALTGRLAPFLAISFAVTVLDAIGVLALCLWRARRLR